MKRLFLFLFIILIAGCGKTPSYGRYSIGRDPTWFPLQIGQYTPSLNAFTNALVQEMRRSERIPLQIIDISWIQLFQSLDNEEIAGIFTSLPPTVEAQSKYTFSEPFLLLGPVLIVREDSKATSLADLKGKIVGISQFDESVLIVQEYPSIIIELYQNMPTALEDLHQGKIDGVLLATLDAHAWIPQLYPDTLKIVSEPLNDKALRLITVKDKNVSLITHFNRGLKKMRHLNKYSKLRKLYELP